MVENDQKKNLLPQPAHDVRTTSMQRRFNVLTSFQRPYNVVLMSCTSWLRLSNDDYFISRDGFITKYYVWSNNISTACPTNSQWDMIWWWWKTNYRGFVEKQNVNKFLWHSMKFKRIFETGEIRGKNKPQSLIVTINIYTYVKMTPPWI